MSDDVGPDEAPPWLTWPAGFAASAEDRRAVLVLSALRTITPHRLIELATECGTAAAVLAHIRDGRAGSDGDRRFARSLDAEELAARAEACGARIVTWASTEYPTQLEQIHDPPVALYVIGGRVPDVTSAVAVVGARTCTALGREQAAELGKALALAGVTVVSGAARGIDAAAHEGALSVYGATLAVLGCGVDVPYDPAGGGLVRRLAERGTIVTEFAPGTRPEPRNFPARNRIVAGLCRAIVAVEGAVGSGSLITAEHAMEFGREVYALPGSVTNPMAHVPLQLIRDGAAMIRGADDLLHDLRLESEPTSARDDLEEVEVRALAALVGPTLPEHIASSLGVGVPEAVTLLMELELRGFVRNVGGRYETTLKGAVASAP
ncbi:MAG TPA: DNA-processing protein DprA [Actinomycetota bacterium]|nr:DNA-processing protein DprA [Actinomycetota bacterium]